MKSFKASFTNLPHAGSSSSHNSPASLLADQCTKAFAPVPKLLEDVRSISTPESVLEIELGLVRATATDIGETLAKSIGLHLGSCSKKDIEIIQTALSTATTNINTCCEVARKAQKKKKWDKDPQKKLEENWYLFCMQMIKISKMLPLGETEQGFVKALCDNAAVSYSSLILLVDRG